MHTRTLLPALLLLATACTGADPVADGPTTPGADTEAPGASPSASASPQGTSDDRDDATPDETSDPTPDEEGADGSSSAVPALDAQCSFEPGTAAAQTVRVAVPSSWQVEGGCEFLDPELDELPEEQDVDAAVALEVAPTAYRDVVGPSPARGESRRFVGSVAGLQAVRIASASTGEGLRPEGTPTLTHAVDLAGDGGQDATLVLSTAVSSERYDLAAEALDRVADTIVVQPGAAPDVLAPGTDRIAVTRVAGGGTPYTITHEDGCLQLRPGGPDGEVTDEACDLDTPMSAAVLDGDVVDGAVVVGVAPPTATHVRGDDDTAPAGALTTSVEGASLYAWRADGVPDVVTAVDAAGGELDQVEVGGTG